MWRRRPEAPVPPPHPDVALVIAELQKFPVYRSPVSGIDPRLCGATVEILLRMREETER